MTHIARFSITLVVERKTVESPKFSQGGNAPLPSQIFPVLQRLDENNVVLALILPIGVSSFLSLRLSWAWQVLR